MKKTLNILMVGDIIGQPGLRAFVSLIQGLKRRFDSDFVVVNGENADDGFGLTPDLATQLWNAGADMITTGNHVWQNQYIHASLEANQRLLRPANYPHGCPGRGHGIVERSGIKLGVVNLQGRTRMWPIDCPFRKGRELVRKLRSETPFIVVDMHAEAPDEKEALAWYLDGEVGAVVGTHTHIQTADERILPQGTAYLGDLGASAPRNSVIGFDYDISVRRVLTMVPLKNEVGKEAAILRGVSVALDRETGKALRIERFAEQALV